MKIQLLFFLLYSSLSYAQTIPLFFKGNQEIASRELYAALGLYKPYIYEFYKDEPAVDPKTLPIVSQTLVNYYKTKGFYHAGVTYTQNEKAIIIELKENVPIRIADITILSNLDISSKIPFKQNDIFDAEKFIQSKKEIKLLYANNHHCNAQLDAKAWIDIETNDAYLIYDVTPNESCYFANVIINTSENIDEDIIKSLLYINEEELFSLHAITKSYQSLYAYDGILKALIDTEIDDNNSVDATVTITENEKPIRFEIGMGASSNEGLMASLGLKHRNLYGDLKTLDLKAKVTEIKQTVKTNFDMPLLHKNTFGVELGFANEIFDGFKESRVFGKVYLNQRRTPTFMKESLFFDRVDTYESEDKALFPEGTLFVLSPKFEWSYDTRDKILDPSKGYFFGSEVMGSILGEVSDASYYKYKLSGGYILPISSTILALKVKYGSLHLYEGDIPASYRFFAGGMDSNRAYGYRKLGLMDDNSNPIGFDSVFETKIEERFPIYGDIKGVVFNDNTYIGANASPDFSKGYYSVGFGLRYATPIGPLAIDYGFDISNPRSQHALHFHIGESF
ncbi:MAG: BamA/TamA family outer membrane protein [Helicobacteraceae bacterium]|nr:BamA/TamA family outer membrane protein [Candidatus Sulfurimonas ponti]